MNLRRDPRPLSLCVLPLLGTWEPEYRITPGRFGNQVPGKSTGVYIGDEKETPRTLRYHRRLKRRDVSFLYPTKIKVSIRVHKQTFWKVNNHFFFQMWVATSQKDTTPLICLVFSFTRHRSRTLSSTRTVASLPTVRSFSSRRTVPNFCTGVIIEVFLWHVCSLWTRTRTPPSPS